MKKPYIYLKRLLDIVISFTALLLLSPIMLALVWLIRYKLGSPVLFCQQRPGLNGQIFTLYKFRTMTDARDAEGNLLPDAQRLLPIGRILRSTSLDELPELWNVLKGEMSLVGPRPLLKEYLPYYSERERHRHTVRPGITGLAQVNGRTNLSWEERFDLDLKYVEELSFGLDVQIMLKTVMKVIKRSDIRDSAPQGSLSSYRSRHSPHDK